MARACLPALQSTRAFNPKTCNASAFLCYRSDRHAAPLDDQVQSALGKTRWRNHEIAAALWRSGVYEARILVSFAGDPARLTAAQMDRWCRDFDNGAFCDAMSFNLFDRSPHAWAKVAQWSKAPGEFQKRTCLCAALEPVDARQTGRQRGLR